MSALAARTLPLRVHRARITVRLQPTPAVVRTATASDVAAIGALIADHLAEGRLLPRGAADIAAHIDRFVVATVAGRVVGCADLAPLSPRSAEVRSLVVAADARLNGVGRRLLDVLIADAREGGYARLCAFTHSARYFVRAGFSIVPHSWVPEKIALDCHGCAQFRWCGQHAVVLTLTERPVPGGPIHG